MINHHTGTVIGETIIYLVEGTLVPVFLQELLLAFRLLITSAFGVFHILSESLFLRQRAPSLNLFSFEFPLNFGLFITFYTRQLP